MLTRKQKEILDIIVSGEWKLNSEGLVDADSGVYWSKYPDYEEIKDFQGIKFGSVDGRFDCQECHKLECLEGSPLYVGKSYDLDNCVSLKSLEGISQDIQNNLYVQKCTSLHSLKGIGNVGVAIFSEGTPLIEGFDNLTEEEKQAIWNMDKINLT